MLAKTLQIKALNNIFSQSQRFRLFRINLCTVMIYQRVANLRKTAFRNVYP
jgi:hypothetical protein